MKILFVCTGNSARSQMAEGFARELGKGRIEAFSAGIDPKGVNPFAIEVMREKGIDISHHQSRAFSEDFARTMDCVITVCGNAEARCPVLPPGVRRAHWPLDDPAQAKGSHAEIVAVFRQSRDAIEQRVRDLLANIR
jgi:arsenate reductase